MFWKFIGRVVVSQCSAFSCGNSLLLPPMWVLLVFKLLFYVFWCGCVASSGFVIGFLRLWSLLRCDLVTARVFSFCGCFVKVLVVGVVLRVPVLDLSRPVVADTMVCLVMLVSVPVLVRVALVVLVSDSLEFCDVDSRCPEAWYFVFAMLHYRVKDWVGCDCIFVVQLVIILCCLVNIESF